MFNAHDEAWSYYDNSDTASTHSAEHETSQFENATTAETAYSEDPFTKEHREQARVREHMNRIMQQDSRWPEQSKQMTNDDLLTLRYKIKTENPDLSSKNDKFDRDTLFEHAYENVLAQAFQSMPAHSSSIATDDRRDEDVSISENSLGMRPAEQLDLNTLVVKNQEVRRRRHHHTVKHHNPDHRIHHRSKGGEVHPLEVDKMGKFYFAKKVVRKPAPDERIEPVLLDRFTRIVETNKLISAKPILALPTLMKKVHVERKTELKKLIGPTTYDPTIYYELQKQKRLNLTRGTMLSKLSRFHKDDLAPSKHNADFLNPYETLDKANDHYKHPGNRTLFEGAPRCFRKTITTGSSPVGPGTYEVKSSIQEVLDRKAFLFSELKGCGGKHKPRDKLGPGYYYTAQPFTASMNTSYTKFKGKFRPIPPPELPHQTGERIVALQPLWPNNWMISLPAPNFYNVNCNICPASKTSKGLNNGVPARPVTRWNPDSEVGPQRYYVNCEEKCKQVGRSWPFKSKTPGRLPFAKFKKLSERLTNKNMPSENMKNSNFS